MNVTNQYHSTADMAIHIEVRRNVASSEVEVIVRGGGHDIIGMCQILSRSYFRSFDFYSVKINRTHNPKFYSMNINTTTTTTLPSSPPSSPPCLLALLPNAERHHDKVWNQIVWTHHQSIITRRIIMWRGRRPTRVVGIRRSPKPPPLLLPMARVSNCVYNSISTLMSLVSFSSHHICQFFSHQCFARQE